MSTFTASAAMHKHAAWSIDCRAVTKPNDAKALDNRALTRYARADGIGSESRCVTGRSACACGAGIRLALRCMACSSLLLPRRCPSGAPRPRARLGGGLFWQLGRPAAGRGTLRDRIGGSLPPRRRPRASALVSTGTGPAASSARVSRVVHAGQRLGARCHRSPAAADPLA